MDEKLGVFICTGYGIAEALDIEALRKVAVDELKVEFCETVVTCEGPGLDEINEVITRENLTRVVVAGISARRFDHSSFPDGVIVEPVPLREHVVWCQPKRPAILGDAPAGLAEHRPGDPVVQKRHGHLVV